MSYRSLKDGDLATPISLGDFFEGLGGLMQLPDKAPEPVKPAKQRRPTRFVLPLAAAGLAILLVALKPNHQADATVPVELLGSWETRSEKYRDRTLEITPTTVVFHNGPAREDWSEHLVTGVQSRQAGDTALVTFSYLEAGTDYELSLKYAATPERGIRFTNQDELVWRPAQAPTH